MLDLKGKENSNIGSKLLKLRKSVNISRSDVEKKYGISAATIRYWENQDASPPAKNLERYLRIFRYEGINIDIETLLEQNLENLSYDIEEKLANSNESSNDFLKTSFAQELLAKSTNLILYANIQGEILFFNENFNYLLNANINCNINKNSIFLIDLVPEINKILNSFLSKVLQGATVMLETTLNNKKQKFCLKLKPNNYLKTIVGFSMYEVTE